MNGSTSGVARSHVVQGGLICMKKCPNHEYKVFFDEENFCEECGGKLVQKSKFYCPCGNYAFRLNNYCTACGQKCTYRDNDENV